MLFSATFDEHVLQFIQKEIPDPFEVRKKKDELALTNVLQYTVRCQEGQQAEEERFHTVYRILREVDGKGTAIVFINVTAVLDRLRILD